MVQVLKKQRLLCRLCTYNTSFQTSISNPLKGQPLQHFLEWPPQNNYAHIRKGGLLRWRGSIESACQAGDAGLNPGQEDALEKEMAVHSSILVWEIPWTEEPGRLQSTGLQRVRHDLVSKQQQQGKKHESKHVYMCAHVFLHKQKHIHCFFSYTLFFFLVFFHLAKYLGDFSILGSEELPYYF